MKKINLTEMQAAIDSRQLSESEQPTKRTEQQEQVIEKVWETLTDVYGSTLVNQYGAVMPEAWIALLKGITQGQIKNGLNKLATRDSPFPPNGSEFRQLCLPETISPDGKNSAAYLDIHDPKHPRNDPESPEYVATAPKGIEGDQWKRDNKKAGRTALKDILGGLK